MSESAPGSENLLEDIIQAEPQYSAHHHVFYPAETLKGIAVVASKHSYVHGDPYKTALDLLDETGAVVRMRAITREHARHEVDLRDVAHVASKKTGKAIEDLFG